MSATVRRTSASCPGGGKKSTTRAPLGVGDGEPTCRRGSVHRSLAGSGWVTIHLCGQPGRIGGRTTLSLFGLAPDGVCRAGRVTPAAGALLPHRFTLPCAFRPEGLRAIGGLFSVALSCGSPRLAASQHPVLRSPDLPQRGDHAAVTRSTHRH